MANTSCKIKTAAKANGMSVALFVLNMQCIGHLDLTKKYTGEEYISKDVLKSCKFLKTSRKTGDDNEI